MKFATSISSAALVEHEAAFRTPAPAAKFTVDARRVVASAAAAADAAFAAGKTNREVLLAAKAASGQRNLTYKPHQSTRERERRMRRSAEQETETTAC